jgi:type II secretory pathway component GspD/PulD (secretin)
MIKTLFLIAVIPIVCMTAMADYDPDKNITIEAKNQPLSQVLQRLTQTTGYTFSYNEEWADLNISVKVVNLDLDKTLRKILSNHNFAILYEADGNVRIMIFDDTGGTPDARTTHDRSVIEYVNVGSAEPLRDESLKEENGENETVNETVAEPEPSDDPEEELENDTDEEKEIAD